MATTMENHIHQHDDLNLMGLQELDSHLSLFDPSVFRGESSTPGAVSTSAFGDDQPPHAIIVDVPSESFSQSLHFQIGSRSVIGGQKFPNILKAERVSKLTSDGGLHLRPESARESVASSMATDIDDASSALSSISSKSTSPPELGSRPRGYPKDSSNASKKRQKYDVRPKVSIPTDVAPSEYARQCIAAAESSRLNPYTLHAEEHAMLRKHISHQQVTTYLNIRNGILRLWTRNPTICVMRDEAIGCAKDPRWFDVARICHEWLVRRGYINYGCVETIGNSQENKRSRVTKRKRKVIAVIGAGMSGLGCARQVEGLVSQFRERFHEMGEDIPEVIVVEGRDRIGGRVYSRAFETKPTNPTLSHGSRHTAEMGGMIITGFDRGNPLNIIVRGQLALPYHSLRPETEIFDANGRPVDINRDSFAEQLFNYILERVSEYKFKTSPVLAADGDKDLLDAGREINNEGSRTISEVEDAMSTGLPTSTRESSTADIQMIPVGPDRLTGRAHVEPGIPGVYTAAYKAKEIGWLLKPNVGIEQDLDLENAVQSRSATLGTIFDEALRQFTRIVDFTPLDLRLINWHVANLEYSNAVTINKLSLGGWDLDAGNEWEGKHSMVVGGYQQVPRGLLKCPHPLNVRRSCAVTKIKYSTQSDGPPARIECENGEIIDADYVVSTIPLGVLKQRNVIFEPALPNWKEGPINRIGYGVLNKLVLVYKEAFWNESRDIFGTLRNPANRFSLDQCDYFTQRGRFFQWFNVTNTTGLPTLLALMAGDGAFSTESTPNEVLVAEATRVLKAVFGAKVPAPVEVVVTRWQQDPFSRGSYSYTGPNFQPDDYDIMAKPIGNLFFAGEHTCGTHPATVHGAYISGLRAASEVLETMIGPMDIPEPLILPKDSASKRKSDAMAEDKDPKQLRLSAYETEVWTAVYAALGDRPWRPINNYANPYRLYSKDKWEAAKTKCEQGRRPGKGKTIPNEVKKVVTKMWKEASDEEKRPYVAAAAVEKEQYTAALAEFNVKVAEWDRASLAFRAEYEKAHPSVPGVDEDASDFTTRDRRAKRGVSGYAEDSGSDVEI